MSNRKQFFAILAIGIGLLMLLGDFISFFTIVALLLLIYGYFKFQSGNAKKGRTYLGVGAAILILDNLIFVVGVTLISLGVFYWKGRKVQPREGYIINQNFMSNFAWDEEPWMLRNTSIWHVIGEVDADLSLAIPETKETVVYLQGVMGDIDLSIPEDYGVEIEAFVLLGKQQFGNDQKGGAMNRLVYRTPGYENSEYKAKFVISYLIGDLNVRLT
ncbi:cell wall-active antibiotics response protein LiaF [Paenibacillus sp. 453mf]|uniref:cell wall-active antibiotics response protein LiaF n=1 Tax=Paenibacillus sp. 453mf TaxID=1761874 RepID=UPI0008E43EE5|nr:cell wall-active antibiotics response protein LiaF [Paenibacillus sp. 453mf]SFS92411.1 lia operon protein LiaF [Paenibacillus sp. 453mf]